MVHLLVMLLACNGDPATPRDARPDTPGDAAETAKSFRQIEQLARPGIAEALILTNGSLAAYNAHAPIFKDVPADAVNAVLDEAKTVLRAIYLGACFINGKVTPALDPVTGVHPAGLECHAVGDALFSGGALTTDSQTKSLEYANRVASQFLPDVMRIDLGVPSTYLDVCVNGAPSNAPLLCGGRRLHEDTIDVTYDYLLNGAATTKDQLVKSRLVSDGVTFSHVELENSLNRTSADVDNPAQGHTDAHPNVSNTVFPYSAPAY
jgi:hypothetical protein